MLNYRCIPLLLLIGIFGLAEAADDETEPLLALMTDSVVVEINQPPEKVWAHVKRLYRDGDRYRQMGLIVTPITDDPSAYLGGYRGASKDENDSEVPDLTVTLSAVDEENMFLAMFMDGVSPKGLYMTMDVSPSNTGTRYQATIQGFLEVELPEGESPTAASVPNGVDETISSELKKHWLDDDIVEILGVIALFGFLNRWNDSMGTTLEQLPRETADVALAEQGWSVGKHQG